ncbi:WEB family protein At3g02930, chloroplastic-like [Curcuma longa]|uniref:WEB family protein At3g02930, chloroplastic-like n=1 Tax=Curcuma longa TaxID=136217 RepID=UPI003D9F5308
MGKTGQSLFIEKNGQSTFMGKIGKSAFIEKIALPCSLHSVPRCSGLLPAAALAISGRYPFVAFPSSASISSAYNVCTPNPNYSDLSRSSSSEASNGKATPPTPKVTKTTRNGSSKLDSGSPSPMAKPSSPLPKSSSPVPKLRSSNERSPKSAESKPPTPPIKSGTTPEKQKRASKESELQLKLVVVEEDLRTAREQLASMEKEKIDGIKELEEAKRLADEVNEKLQEAIAAKNKADESLEIEKFRADELEQAAIAASQKRESEYQSELESIQKRHMMDASALLHVTQELQKLKLELENAIGEKKSALSEANNAKKTAEMNGEKMEVLAREVSHLKSLLDSKLDDVNKEAAEMIKKLNAEIGALQLELERVKSAEERLREMEASVERLQMELTDAKKAESDTFKQVDELAKEVAYLKNRLNEAYQSEKYAIESLAITKKKMEEGTALLQDAETEIAVLKGKMESMEIEVASYKMDLKESDRKLGLSQQETVSLGKTVELLKAELTKLEEQRSQALDNYNVSASEIERLMVEKSKLTDELNASKDEGENIKKAMEGLAAALHEMSTESRANQEKLLSQQSEIEDYKFQTERLNSEIKNAEERYEVMLDEARYEIVCLKKTVEIFETENSNFSTEWETKELNFINAIKKSEDEIASLKVEMAKVVDSLKLAEQEAQAAKADGVELLNKQARTESAATTAYKVAEEAKADTLRYKEMLLDKENELQSITQENDDLRVREIAALQKIQELSSLLEETKSNRTDESDKLPKNEKEYSLLSNISQEERPNSEAPLWKHENGHEDDKKSKEENEKVHQNDEEDPTDTMLRDLSSEKDHEDVSVDDDLDSKMDALSYELKAENPDKGTTSPTKNQEQKKKKALLNKFGKLLKKSSHKKP